MKSCLTCSGTGSIEFDRGDDALPASEDCKDCGGTGDSEPNPYRQALVGLLAKVERDNAHPSAAVPRRIGVDEGQRRGIRRAIAEVDRVWSER